MGKQGEKKPWDGEPDYERFSHAGLECIVIRMGQKRYLCGYVVIPEDHPLHGVDYTETEHDDDLPTIDVHGGVTYSGGVIADGAEYGDESLGFCWGFDCAHAGDYSEGVNIARYILGDVHGDMPFGHCGENRYGVYRDFEFVRTECRKMADQIAGVTAKTGGAS